MPPDPASPYLLFVVADQAFFFSHRLDLAMAAQRDGYAIGVAAKNITRRKAELDSLGMEGIEVNFKRSSLNPLQDLRTLREIKTLLKTRKPDLVQAAGMKACLLTGLAGRDMPEMPMAFLFTGLGYLFSNQDRKARLARKILPATLFRRAFNRPQTASIFHNPADREQFIRQRYVTEGQSYVVHGSGVDIRHFTPSPESSGAVTILLPARILRDKGIAEFCSAAKKLHPEYPDVRYILAGSLDTTNPTGLSQADIESLIKDSPVTWIGFQQDMASFYKKAHIVCLPSYHEGLPRSLLEAAASGRPVVVTDIPGNRSIVTEGENGFLVPVGDSEALACALEKLMIDKNLRERFGRTGREKVIQMATLDAVNSRMLRIYQTLLPQHAPVDRQAA